MYHPVLGEQTLIYGGNKNQTQTFDSKTHMTVTYLEANQVLEHSGECMAYLAKGEGVIQEEELAAKTLIRTNNLIFSASNNAILIYQGMPTQLAG